MQRTALQPCLPPGLSTNVLNAGEANPIAKLHRPPARTAATVAGHSSSRGDPSQYGRPTYGRPPSGGLTEEKHPDRFPDCATPSLLPAVKDTGIELTVVSVDEDLPPLIDDGLEYLPDPTGFDLVLDFLKHPDLSYDLADHCSRAGVPVVASGKKHRFDGAHTPPT